ncbi:MAG TPA: nucleoside deaminase [Bacteroidales bacterium]|jgi:tRNA(adenine34) deaminase|nr:nucleoside deaminase [Bacteroidales bacterium]
MIDDEYYMRAALVEAEMALEKDEIPIGAIIVCNDKIIAKAHNLTESLCDTTAHAEMQAFTSAFAYLGSKYLKDCTLYVTLEPCVMCAGAAYWTQIDRVVFGAYDLKNTTIKNKEQLYHPQTKITGGILADECAAILTRFFKMKR